MGLAALVVLLLIGRADATLLRNQPPVVEQQTGTGCALDFDLSDCVTNTGPCVWDADDTLWTSLFSPRHLAAGASVSTTVCVYADWDEHFVGMRAYIAAKGGQPRPYRISLTTEPPGNCRAAPCSLSVDTTTREGARLCTSTPDYDREDPLPEVPYQGGGGGVLGHAVYTTVTFTITNTGDRPIVQNISVGIEVSFADHAIGCEV